MDKNGSGWKVLERAKAKKKIESPKEQSEAKQLFYLFFPEAMHWKVPSILVPFGPTTYIPYFKQAALAILGTGIIGENGLKGHAGHKKTFPVNQRDLISALIEVHFKYHDVTFSPGDILKHFDDLFESVAAFARLAGVRDRGGQGIKTVHKEWRKKVSLAVSQSKMPYNWRELIKVELISSWKYHSRSEAQAFAILFLQYAPEASESRIALWVNAILKSLGQRPVSSSNLREYIKKEWQRRHVF